MLETLLAEHTSECLRITLRMSFFFITYYTLLDFFEKNIFY